MRVCGFHKDSTDWEWLLLLAAEKEYTNQTNKRDWERDCLLLNLSVRKISLPQGLNIESLTNIKLNALPDTCLRHLFLADPRSFYDFWNIQGALLRVSQTSEGLHGKVSKDTVCYYLPTSFGIVNNNKSKEGRLFFGGRMSKVQSQHLHVFCWSILEMLLSLKHYFSNVAFWELALLVKGPPSNLRYSKNTNLLSSDRHKFDFYLPLETLTELSCCTSKRHSFSLL